MSLEEDRILSASMQKLKIMPKRKHAKIFRDDALPLKHNNPFSRKLSNKINTNTHIFGPICTCKKIHILKNKPSFKRSSTTKNNNNNKVLLKESAFILTKCTKMCQNYNCAKNGRAVLKPKLFGENSGQEYQDFKSIITGCEQLCLSARKSENMKDFSTKHFRERQQIIQQKTEKSISSNNNNSSCSQQAMAGLSLNPPCDVTIDELASYFETFVHIPKKMSSMAEMMYI